MSHRAPSTKQQGSVLLLVVLMLLVFAIIAGASIRFIARQSNQTVQQEQEEQAFEIADAGANYVLWLLSASGGNKSPLSLVASPPPSTRDHAIANQAGQSIGKFDLFFGPACPDSLSFRSVGYDQIKTNLCQVVDGTAKLFSNGEYRLIKWDHLVGYPCNQSYVPPSPEACAPQGLLGSSPSPSSTPTPTPSCNPALCPSGWQCGTGGTCEPNSCDDATLCTDDSTCPPDHERVSFCTNGVETYRDWSCCESCNADLQLLCGAVSGGYCTPTYYDEPCGEAPIIPIPQDQCAILGGECGTTGAGTIECCPGEDLTCHEGICIAPEPAAPPECAVIGTACHAVACCENQGLACVEGFCLPEGAASTPSTCGELGAACGGTGLSGSFTCCGNYLCVNNACSKPPEAPVQ